MLAGQEVPSHYGLGMSATSSTCVDGSENRPTQLAAAGATQACHALLRVPSLQLQKCGAKAGPNVAMSGSCWPIELLYATGKLKRVRKMPT